MEVHDIFLDRLPKVDLHGFDKDSAMVMTNDFVKEAMYLNYDKIVIIHGIGEGIVKKAVHDTLAKNKYVKEYKLDNFNSGCTIVTLRKREENIDDNENGY